MGSGLRVFVEDETLRPPAHVLIALPQVLLMPESRRNYQGRDFETKEILVSWHQTWRLKTTSRVIIIPYDFASQVPKGAQWAWLVSAPLCLGRDSEKYQATWFQAWNALAM